MRVTVSAKVFLRLLRAAKKATGSRSPKQVLRKVKLVFTPGGAEIRATDQEVGLVLELPCDVEGSFECLVEPDRLIALLKEARKDTDCVQIDCETGTLTLYIGTGLFELTCEGVDDFPDVPGSEGEACYLIRSLHLRDAISRTEFSADLESTRYALGGINFDLKAAELVLAATDSRRLAIASAPMSRVGDPEDPAQAPIIPHKALRLLLDNIPDDKPVLMQPHKNDVVFVYEGGRLFTRMVEGRFPRYGEVVPRTCEHKIGFTVGPMQQAVRHAAVQTTAESRGIDFEFCNNVCTLRSVGTDVGRGTVECRVQYDSLQKLVVTLDPAFMLDFFKVLDARDEVVLGINDETAAVLLTSGISQYVVMPLARDVEEPPVPEAETDGEFEEDFTDPYYDGGQDDEISSVSPAGANLPQPYAESDADLALIYELVGV